MVPPLVRLSDVEARLGTTYATAEVARPLAIVDDASALVRTEAGRTWVLGDGVPDVVPPTIAAITIRIAIRAIENPEGFTTESGGDYSYSRKGVEDGVYLTEREARMVRKAAGKTGLWTQPLERGDLHGLDTGWVWDQYGTEPIAYDVYRDQV